MDSTENVKSISGDVDKFIDILNGNAYNENINTFAVEGGEDVSLMDIMDKTIPISMFNKGMAGKIFTDVKNTGAKVVLKNNAPECVLMSPEEYVRFMDEVNDARLALIAAERMAERDPSKFVTHEEMLKKHGITEEDLEGYDEVEFE